MLLVSHIISVNDCTKLNPNYSTFENISTSTDKKKTVQHIILLRTIQNLISGTAEFLGTRIQTMDIEKSITSQTSAKLYCGMQLYVST